MVRILTVGLVNVLLGLPVQAEMRMATTRFALKGKSTGGVMILTKVPGAVANHAQFVVTNLPGDDSATVLERLVRSLAAHGFVLDRPAPEKRDWLVLPGGGSLWRDGKVLEAPAWIAGGDDLGFNIPPAPLFLSATYVSNQVILRWVNEVTYDSLWVCGGVWESIPIEVLPGNTEEFACDIVRLVPPNWPWPEGTNVLIAVVGVKDGVPSTAAAIKLVDFTKQEPVVHVPFSRGVVPGFRFWSRTPTGAKVQCKQGIIHSTPLGGGTEIWRLKYYQVFNANGGFQAGLYRRWLGLKPGHTYRVSATLRSLGSQVSGVSIGLFGAELPRGSADLTPAQMIGEEPLPGGKRGKAAGLLGWVSAGVTNGNASMSETMQVGSNLSGTVGGEFTLSDRSDSIAVWVRVESQQAAEVGLILDSLVIEELGKR